MDFRILGPLEVLEDGRPLALGRLKERIVLAVLLLHANEFVSRERLIDDLWGASPPATARKAVNVYISKLRMTLTRGGHDPIATADGGYRLVVEPGLIDADRMRGLVAKARERMAVGETAGASQLLQQALAFWRGPTLAGLVLESLGRDEAAKLDELRLTVLMDRIDCDLAEGRHEDVLGELQVLVREHPLRERLRAQQMLALYRADRQADALDVYQHARHDLIDELGIEPSESLQRLQQAILRHDPSLETPGGTAAVNGLARSAAPRPPPHPAADGVLLRRFRRRRRQLALAAFVILSACATAAAFTALSGGQEASIRAAAHSLAQVDPRSGRVVADIPLSGTPIRDAATPDAIWVIDQQAGTLTRVEPDTRAVVRTIPVGGGLTDVAATRKAVWALATNDGQLVRIDPASDQVVARIPVTVRGSATGLLSIESSGLAVSGHYVYVNGVSTAWKLESRTGKRVGRLSEDSFAEVAVAAGALWTADVRSDGTGNAVLERHDLNTSAVTGTLKLRSAPVGVVSTRAGVWVVEADGQVLHLDRNEVVLQSSTDIGGRPTSVVVLGNALWITDAAGDRLVRVDGDTGQVTDRIQLAAEPHGLATDGHSLWVTLPYAASPDNAY